MLVETRAIETIVRERGGITMDLSASSSQGGSL
jgi:hypothetical protein